MEITYSGLLAPKIEGDKLRTRIFDLQEQMLSEPQVQCEIKNIFGPGVMLREMTIPAGVVVVGAEHKSRHLNIISKGRIVVWTEVGMKELSAPCTFESMPGTKRAGYALEETVWTTIHENPGNETDIAVLCERYTTSKHTELMEYRAAIENREAVCLGE